jgi:hypothetical protein
MCWCWQMCQLQLGQVKQCAAELYPAGAVVPAVKRKQTAIVKGPGMSSPFSYCWQRIVFRPGESYGLPPRRQSGYVAQARRSRIFLSTRIDGPVAGAAGARSQIHSTSPHPINFGRANGTPGRPRALMAFSPGSL